MAERQGHPVAAAFLFLPVLLVTAVLGVSAYLCLDSPDLSSFVSGTGPEEDWRARGWVFVVGMGVVVIGGMWLVLRVGSGRRGARERP